MIIEILPICAKSWKIIFLLNEFKIDYISKQLPINSLNKYPLINNFCDLSFIAQNWENFLTEDDLGCYGHWLSLIDCDFLPLVVNPIKKERVFNPLIERKFTNLENLKMLRKSLKKYLEDYSKYFQDHIWINKKNFSLMDISLSSAIAVLDYLGEIPWKDSNYDINDLYIWYIKIKSRKSFKLLMKERCPGIAPHPFFDKLDF